MIINAQSITSYIEKLPTESGVYKIHDINRKIIYIGKAKNIKKRVIDHFNIKKYREKFKGSVLANSAYYISYIVTKNETDALLLECKLIKRFLPKYNVMFKDDKEYPYLYISDEKFPGIYIEKKYNSNSTGTYYGPYTTGINSLKKAIEEIQKIFQIRSCKNSISPSNSNPCLKYQINICSAPCAKLITEESYNKNIQLLKSFLAGKRKQIINNLNKQMKKESLANNYELALKTRNKINSLTKINKRSEIIASPEKAIDVITIEKKLDYICIGFMKFLNGVVIKEKTYLSKFFDNESESEILKNFIIIEYIKLYIFNDLDPISTIPPKEILINKKICQYNELERIISKNIENEIKLFTINKNSKKYKMIKLCKLLVKKEINKKIASENNNTNQVLVDLKLLFQLEKIPAFIDCFDVSHLLGKSLVGACCSFSRITNKITCIQYDINNKFKNNDCLSIFDIIQQHYTQAKRDDFTILLVDGGKGQLRSAINSIEGVFDKDFIKQNFFIIGLAKKNDFEINDKLYIYNNGFKKIEFPKITILMKFLQTLRDKAHNFAVTKQRFLTNKTHEKSFLQSIPGIGTKKSALIINSFKSLAELKKATISEINNIQLINKKLAEKIHFYIQKI